jgi:hypothetical protein
MPEHARSFTQLQDHNGLLWASECNSLRERRFTSAHESVKGKPACYKVAHLALHFCSEVVQVLLVAAFCPRRDTRRRLEHTRGRAESAPFFDARSGNGRGR